MSGLWVLLGCISMKMMFLSVLVVDYFCVGKCCVVRVMSELMVGVLGVFLMCVVGMMFYLCVGGGIVMMVLMFVV